MRKILVVDDNAANADIITLILKSDKFQVMHAENLHYGYAMLSFRPDLVLLDVTFPDGDGKDLCRHIKANKETAATPVILMSARHDVALMAKNCGADDFIEKPFGIDELRKMVHGFISKKQEVDSCIVLK